MSESNKPPTPKSQLDKFKDLAKTVETEDNEAAFDRALKRVAKSPAPKPKADE
jgi:hypothetical protein